MTYSRRDGLEKTINFRVQSSKLCSVKFLWRKHIRFDSKKRYLGSSSSRVSAFEHWPIRFCPERENEKTKDCAKWRGNLKLRVVLSPIDRWGLVRGVPAVSCIACGRCYCAYDGHFVAAVLRDDRPMLFPLLVHEVFLHTVVCHLGRLALQMNKIHSSLHRKLRARVPRQPKKEHYVVSWFMFVAWCWICPIPIRSQTRQDQVGPLPSPQIHRRQKGLFNWKKSILFERTKNTGQLLECIVIDKQNFSFGQILRACGWRVEQSSWPQQLIGLGHCWSKHWNVPENTPCTWASGRPVGGTRPFCGTTWRSARPRGCRSTNRRRRPASRRYGSSQKRACLDTPLRPLQQGIRKTNFAVVMRGRGYGLSKKKDIGMRPRQRNSRKSLSNATTKRRKFLWRGW